MKQRVFTGVLLSIVGLALLFSLPVAAATLPVAGFVSNVTSGSSPLHVRFMDVSTNSPAEWIWSFGDGDTSAAQNPAHVYTSPGSYTVTLAATNPSGSTTVTKTEYIMVTRPVIPPVASFVSNMSSGTGPVAVQFLDTSTHSPTSWDWSFGDGGTSSGPSPSHLYTSAGVYTVTLTVTNAAGSNRVTQTGYITVGASANEVPVARFVSTMYSGNVPLKVQFIDASTGFPVSWVWLFGDGDSSTEQNPSHSYTSIGTYNVSLTSTNAWGNHTVVRENYITVGSPVPVASFISSPVSGTAPLSIQFTDTSTNSPSSWDWTFGDGGASALQNPAYVYTRPGVYTVSFSATNAAGRGTVIRSDYVTVSVISPPLASFSSDIQKGPVPLTVMFSDESTGSPSSWAWSFGDGAVAAVKNPSHTYTTGGSFTVTLVAANAGGSNTTTLRDYIIVSGYPVTDEVRTVRETAAPGHPSATTASSRMTGSAEIHATDSILSATGMSSEILPLILVPVLLGVTGIVIIWWRTRPPLRPGGRRGRDL
ncbi:MAG: PKD domain-containing protein [Methanoregula sp.]